MLPARSGYAIRDSKLNRAIGSPSTEHVRLQLETYGWLYEQNFGEPPVALQVHTGTDQIHQIEYEGGGDALATFEEILVARTSEEAPEDHVGVSKCSGCSFNSYCWPMAVERQDVGLLPWVDRGLVDELHKRGAGTLPELLEKFDAESLAALERPWKDGTKPFGGRAERTLINARAIVEDRPILISPPEIPEHDTYVMFDLEGTQTSLDELEKIYIWGMQPFGANPGRFRTGTAGFGRLGDRDGWEDFLRNANELLVQHGDIPFVHWASYEKTKINVYLERYGDREGVAERVKRNLLDLLPITRAAVAVPLSGYGLKQIETLTDYERQLDESGGEWSMAKYVEATETDDELERASIMEEILAYNREDLEATWAVMTWLRGLQAS
jgi:predicted RecB family nuclease